MNMYIVDDTAFIRILCRYHLTKAGHHIVGENYDGAEAAKEIQKLQPDCVVVDLALPNKNGLQVMKEIKAQFPQIHFIVISSLDKDMVRDDQVPPLYDAFLVKPFEASDLVRVAAEIESKLQKDLHG